ncbi:MAG: phenylalanine--tRNA ligase subunit beta [Alphaproteobacteria bacterium]|nr:phenylalanine--tRNA ligase subunit beta [Alphaproteobacteria bacterium]
MKFPLSWLKQHLDTPASLTEICDKLTAIGLEVEGIEDHGKKLAPFIVAQVLEAAPHPGADRLRVCTVDTGKEKLQVVCGAPNARAGIKVVLARPGDVMPDSGEALKKGVIRGVESQGMLCAVDELGIGDAHSGIIELGEDAPVGGSFAAYAGYDDPVIEINLTPNRPDCAGVLGIARDLAAAGLGELKPLDTTPVKGTEASRIKVKLEFPSAGAAKMDPRFRGDDEPSKACPLFIGRLIRNIKNGSSPEGMQRRLRAIGLRPISALVDITNYLTIDCARPLHVFDAKKIKGGLRLGPAQGGEVLDALNGKTYTLEAGMTTIYDDAGAVSLAGIVGGVRTSCDENTTEVFVESAYFDPVRTALTGRALQISSDARYRFERGIDPLFTETGAELATKLILELCGTPETTVSPLEIAGNVTPRTEAITLDTQKCLKHTGVAVAESEQAEILTRLGFAVTRKNGKLDVIPPSWRPDIEGDADLVEEIIRIKGFDHLPVTSLPRLHVITKTAIDAQDIRANAARRALADQGLMEAVTWSFMPSVIAASFGGVSDDLRLVNPISSDLDVMRPSILGNLLSAAKRNADRGFAAVGLFEIGPVFKDLTPEGQAVVATAVRCGQTPRHWAAASRACDVFDAKGDATAALAAAGAPVAALQITSDAPDWYHPGRSGALRLGANVLAYFGEIHPSVLTACDLSGPAVGCELFLANIPAPRSSGTAKPLLKLDALQPVSRDFAFVVERKVTAAKLVQAVKAADKNLIREVAIFDVYEGDKISSDKKSLALNVTLQPQGKSLTDAEIEAVSAKITAAVGKATGAVLRG